MSQVAIIGQGVVGRSQVELFAGDYDLVTYDPIRDDDYPLTDIGECDFAVICVGTPEAEDGFCDLDYITEAARQLPLDMPVLVRSTVPPGTTDALFAGLRCHCPEFMGENPAHPWQTSASVPFCIIGGDGPSRAFFKERLDVVLVEDTPIYECTAMEAEMTKYVSNLYWAARVTFVNEMAEICRALGIDYEQVRKGWMEDPRMDDAYTRRDGFPAGFGGRCWPKDLSALRHAAAEAGYPAYMLRALADLNAIFQDTQRLA